VVQKIGFILSCIESAQPGNELIVDTPEGKRRLKITTLPLLDQDKAIPWQSLR